MIVTWERRSFEIDIRQPGAVETWRLVRESGTPLTAEQFHAIPADGQQRIAKLIELYRKLANENLQPAGAT